MIREDEFEIDDKTPPEDLAPWFKQFLKLDTKKREAFAQKVMDRLYSEKKEAYEFIRKFNCELVGISPRIVYTLVDAPDGELDVTWIHSFSMPTLLFWCKQGGFGFFVNPNLNYDDTVLNKVKGNKQQSIKGFTG